MSDFTSAMGPNNDAMNAAYRRGYSDAKREGDARVMVLEADRTNFLQVLIDVLYDDNRRQEVKQSLLDAYGIEAGVEVTIVPDLTNLDFADKR